MKSRQDLECRKYALERATLLANHLIVKPENVTGLADQFLQFLVNGPEMTEEDINNERWG